MQIEDCPSPDAAPVPTVLTAPQEAAPIHYGKHPETRSITMPSVLDEPELIEYVETHELTTDELTIEQPQPRKARPGFWRTLAHRITKHLHRTPRARQVPPCSVPQPFETPMDRMVREHQWLSILALASI
jgi:hypothetical protein